ncbi:MAG: hypothetical protein IPK84_01245 [Candidatus Moraniibacteriota bacterium]|nr:MAG: hypothetical protein IPK84_01245 [Candidatus Moranbacteria bacterium]
MRIEGESPTKKVGINEEDDGRSKEKLNSFEVDNLQSEELQNEVSSLRETHNKEIESILRNRELRIEKMRNAEKVISALYADLQIAEITGAKPEKKARIKERIKFLEDAISYFDDEIAKVENFDYSNDLKGKAPDLTSPLDRLHEDANRENIRKTNARLLEEGVGQYSDRMQLIYDNMERESLTLQVGEEKGSKNFDATVESLVEKIKNVLSSALIYQRDFITKKMRELEGNGEWQPLGFSGSLPGRLLADLQEKIQRNEGKRHSDMAKLDSLWRAVAPKVGSFVM